MLVMIAVVVVVLGALAHMFLQRGGHYEGSEAVLAQGAGPAFLPVGLHVSRQLRGLRASVVTQAAFVRLLSRMRSSMYRQV